MIPRLHRGWPLFELALLIVLVALGWAAFHTHTTLNEVKRLPETPPETQKIQEILKLHDLADIRDRYEGVADRIESGLNEMKDALQGFIREKDRSELGRYRSQSQALGAALRKERENLDARKLQALRDWLAGISSVEALGTNSIALDLDLVLGRATQNYSNYTAAVGLYEGRTITADAVRKQLVRAFEFEEGLYASVRQARSQAAAIGQFVERRPGELERQSSAHSQATAFSNLLQESQTTLQPLFYTLVVTVILQSALLIVAIYGRFVVAPLRQKLIEDNTAIEHQRKLDHFARLATGLAHEIRNPLTAINVRLFTLQKSLNRGTSEHNDATLIRSEIDRLEQILKNFLRLSRPAETKLSTLNAGVALKEVRDLLAPQLQRQAIDLRLDSVADAPFQADPTQLKQVLINLIQNAADSIGRKGTITLRARQDETRLSGRQTDSVVLEVEDTGCGMAPDVQERLFDPFFSPKENGTGLGLPIAAKIIDQHHGMLDFESRLGHGTTFRVILPAKSP